MQCVIRIGHVSRLHLAVVCRRLGCQLRSAAERELPDSYTIDANFDLALLVLSCAFAEVVCRFGRFYGFDFAGADREMERLVQTGFPGEGVVL